jgi:hypothetical protein
MEILAVMFIYLMLFYMLWLAIVWIVKLPFRIFKWIFGSEQEVKREPKGNSNPLQYKIDNYDPNYRKRQVGDIRRDHDRYV